MAGTPAPNLLQDAVVYMAAALAVVPVFYRLKLGAVLGYLVAGMLIGPHLFGLVDNPNAALAFAEFGVVLLLFVIGLELRPKRLWDLRLDIFGLGAAQVLMCGLVVTAFLLAVTSLTWQAALVVGLPLALSSTALVVQILQERGLMNTPLGERSFAVLLFQDLSIVPMLTIVAALSRAPGSDAGAPGWTVALHSLGAIVGLVLAGRFLLNPLFRLIGQIGAREAFVVAGLFTVSAAALIMASLGLSMALGAFIAGVMLADSPYRHEVEADIEPFRGLFLGLFFIAIGMTLDLSVIAERLGEVLGIVAGVMAIKATVIALLARWRGLAWQRAFWPGLLLAQGGEFGFVLFAAAERGLLLSPDATDLFSAVVTVSMAATPLLIALVDWIAARREIVVELEGPEFADNAPAIIVGYGRFGQTVNQILAARGIPVTLIDRKPEQIELTGRFGRKVYYGDGTRVDVLRTAGAAEAQLLIFCGDGDALTATTVTAIRRAFPNLKIVARAFDRRHVMALTDAGLDAVVREVHDGAVALSREALRLAGVEAAQIDAIEADYRRRDGERLALQIATGDLRAGLDLAYGTFPLPPTVTSVSGEAAQNDQPAATHETMTGAGTNARD
jgi:monovalent cation:proton antiporter-2 (CPA2) family protein